MAVLGNYHNCVVYKNQTLEFKAKSEDIINFLLNNLVI